MWRKHPIARLIIGLAVVLAVLGTLGAAFILGADYWQDGQQAPQRLEGTVISITRQPPSTLPGRFKLSVGSEIYDFELKNGLLRRLDYQLQSSGPTRPVTVTFSPRVRNIYSIQVSGGDPLIQDIYDPTQSIQSWQRLPFYALIIIAIFGLAALGYAILALLDWLLPLQRMQGALVARIERAEVRNDGFSIIVRPWNSSRPGKQLQFELRQTAFLATDSVDFVEVAYTRLFRFVRNIKAIPLTDLPSQGRETLLGLSAEGLRFSYSPGWRLRVFLYADGLLALGLFAVSILILLNYVPEWTNPQRIEPPQWLLLPLISILSAVVGVYLLLRFFRKVQDVNAPKRVAVGPVLSKWRVTGTSNDNRRLIVVADGGLAAGEQGIRKFDLSPALFDQLRVGDIVEIEHTPRLRYICRLEVKGHQELTPSYQI